MENQNNNQQSGMQPEEFKLYVDSLMQNKRRHEKGYLENIVAIMPNLLEYSNKYLDSTMELVQSKEKVSTKLLDILQETREGLQSYLNNNVKDITVEERVLILKNIMKIAEMARDTDREHRKFLEKALIIAGTVIAFVGMLVAKGLSENKNRKDYKDKNNIIDAEYNEDDEDGENKS